MASAVRTHAAGSALTNVANVTNIGVVGGCASPSVLAERRLARPQPANGKKGRIMGHAQIKTVTSREFVHNVSAARRVASEGGTVIITDRGEPALALISIAEYRRLTKTDRNLVELLHMPEADAFDVDIEPVSFHAREIDA